MFQVHFIGLVSAVSYRVGIDGDWKDWRRERWRNKPMNNFVKNDY